MFRPLDLSAGPIPEAAVRRGLARLVLDGLCSQIMLVLSGGAFLAAYALALGASNTVVGMLVALAPASQVLQIPATFLVERLRRRKLLVVVNSSASRVALAVAATIPWLLPPGQGLTLLITMLVLHFGLGAISACSWNSWIRDLVPPTERGRYFGRRLAIATGGGAVVMVVAGVVVGLLEAEAGTTVLPAYGVLFGIAALVGFCGVGALATVPEPAMQRGERRPFRTTLLEPFRDANFRRLLRFHGLWSFVTNLATPFFAVYMLRRLDLGMGWLTGLLVLGFLTNVVFYQVWGRLSDRLSNKSVLAVTAPLFLIAVAAWPFTTFPEAHALTLPLLVVIHVLTGIATAGVLLCGGNIALELAPDGKATAYMAVHALVAGLAALVAPVAGGLLGDLLADSTLRIELAWLQGSGVEAVASRLPALDLRGLDFVFLATVVLGLVCLPQLVAVREEGEVEESVVVAELQSMLRRGLGQFTAFAGLRRLAHFPFPSLRTRSRTRPAREDQGGRGPR